MPLLDRARLRRFGMVAIWIAVGLALGYIFPPLHPVRFGLSASINGWVIYGYIALVGAIFVALAVCLLLYNYSRPVNHRTQRLWRRPPWEHPRVLSGGEQDRADFRWLMKRLDPAPDLEQPDPTEHPASEMLVDRITGQRWRMDRYVHDSTEWEMLTPVSQPSDGDGKE